MALFSGHDDIPETTRQWPKYTFIVLLLSAIAGYFFLSSPTSPPAEVAENIETPEYIAPTLPAPPEEPKVTPPEIVETRPASPPKPEPEPELEPETAITPPPLVLLRITSDISGADVFVDRQYVGTTPFEITDISEGRHRLNVSLEGYDGYAEDIEITDQLIERVISFQAVRLDQRINVIHKHRFGDCKGKLVADTSGILYDTDHKDRFSINLDEMEDFSVDYLEHNLHVKVSGGRSYNFTDDQENADALFVFHREVDKARQRLAEAVQTGS